MGAVFTITVSEEKEHLNNLPTAHNAGETSCLVAKYGVQWVYSHSTWSKSMDKIWLLKYAGSLQQLAYVLILTSIVALFWEENRSEN